MSDYILTCKGLTKNYGDIHALKGIDLKLEPGRFIGLLGPNGSGKTTLMKIIAGVLSQDSGEVLVGGHSIGKNSKAMISYLPDLEYLPDMKIGLIVDLFADFFDDFDKEKALAMLSDMKLKTNQLPKKLSKGNREKLQLILAMSRRAKLYLLDEPIGSIDPAARDYILHTILDNYSEDATVLLSTHLIGDVESILDEAIFLKEGEILAHRDAEELRTTEHMSIDGYFREVFKC